MNCLSCRVEMTSSRCACGCAWLPEDKLAELASDMKGELVALPWQRVEGDLRACPVCHDVMDNVSLAGVALDGCRPHGIWFDADELQKVLAGAAKFPARVLDGPNVSLGRENSGALDDDSSSSSSSSSSSGGGWWILGALLEILID